MGGAALVNGVTLMDKYNLAYGTTDDRFLGRSGRREPEWAWVYRREAIERAGGFDEELAQSEDKDLCRRVKEIGYGIAYVQGINWHHRKPRSLAKFIRKEYNSGKRRAVYDLKLGSYKSILTGLLPSLIIISELAVGSILGWLVSAIAMLTGVALYVGLFKRTHPRSIGSASELVALSLVGLTGRIANSIGSVFGTVIVAAKRVGLANIDLGRL